MYKKIQGIRFDFILKIFRVRCLSYDTQILNIEPFSVTLALILCNLERQLHINSMMHELHKFHIQFL